MRNSAYPPKVTTQVPPFSEILALRAIVMALVADQANSREASGVGQGRAWLDAMSEYCRGLVLNDAVGVSDLTREKAALKVEQYLATVRVDDGGLAAEAPKTDVD